MPALVLLDCPPLIFSSIGSLPASMQQVSEETLEKLQRNTSKRSSLFDLWPTDGISHYSVLDLACLNIYTWHQLQMMFTVVVHFAFLLERLMNVEIIFKAESACFSLYRLNVSPVPTGNPVKVNINTCGSECQFLMKKKISCLLKRNWNLRFPGTNTARSTPTLVILQRSVFCGTCGCRWSHLPHEKAPLKLN